jgi:hypothetical protein
VVTISGILNGTDIVLNEDFNGSNCLLLSGEAHTFTSTISNLKLNTPELSENERLLLTGIDLSSGAISNVTSNLVNLSAVHITAK